MTDLRYELQVLRARMAGIGKRLDGEWAEQLREHLHLDRSTPECAYWHSGYHQALADVLDLVASEHASADISDTSSPRRAVG
jgi:hypothetical protein